MKQMRLQFYDDDLKGKLVDLSKDMDISLNQLVNMICAAHFSAEKKNILDLMIEIAEFQKGQEIK